MEETNNIATPAAGATPANQVDQATNPTPAAALPGAEEARAAFAAAYPPGGPEVLRPGQAVTDLDADAQALLADQVAETKPAAETINGKERPRQMMPYASN